MAVNKKELFYNISTKQWQLVSLRRRFPNRRRTLVKRTQSQRDREKRKRAANEGKRKPRTRKEAGKRNTQRTLDSAKQIKFDSWRLLAGSLAHRSEIFPTLSSLYECTEMGGRQSFAASRVRSLNPAVFWCHEIEFLGSAYYDEALFHYFYRIAFAHCNRNMRHVQKNPVGNLYYYTTGRMTAPAQSTVLKFPFPMPCFPYVFRFEKAVRLQMPLR